MSIIEKLKNPEKPEEDIYIINEKIINFNEVDFFEAIPSKIENSNRLKEKVKTEKEFLKVTIEKLKKQLEDARNAARDKAKDVSAKPKDAPKQTTPPISANQINALRGAGKPSSKNTTQENSAQKTQEPIKQDQQSKSQPNEAETLISQDLAFYEAASSFLPIIESEIDANISTMQNILTSGDTRGYTIIVDFNLLPPPSERQKQNPENEPLANQEQSDNDKNKDKDDKDGKDDKDANGKGNPEKNKDNTKSKDGNESDDKDNSIQNSEKARMRNLINGHRKSSLSKSKPIKKDQLALDVKTLKEKSSHTK